MIKKILSLFTSVFLIQGVLSAQNTQNLQLHYDFRHSLDARALTDEGFPLHTRDYFTLTYEWLEIDRYGETFLFVDFDFSQKNGNLGLLYAELSRKIKFGDFPLQALVEFDGGVADGYTISNAYLAGPSYANVFGKVYVSTYLAYKFNQFRHPSHDVQWTLVWSYGFGKGKFSFDGYFDLWSENRNRQKASAKRLFFMTEPQIWYNILPNFSVGTELETTYGFYKKDTWKCYPTLAIKCTFR